MTSGNKPDCVASTIKRRRPECQMPAPLRVRRYIRSASSGAPPERAVRDARTNRSNRVGFACTARPTGVRRIQSFLASFAREKPSCFIRTLYTGCHCNRIKYVKNKLSHGSEMLFEHSLLTSGYDVVAPSTGRSAANYLKAAEAGTVPISGTNILAADSWFDI